MKRIYFPNLDGLRFFAFLAVFLCHILWTKYPSIENDQVFHVASVIAAQGYLGVNFFFVLSGFLITYLLLAEKSATHRIDIKAFYMRRVLRIWPLYYLVLLIGFYVIPRVAGQMGGATAESGHLSYFLFFLNNFDVQPTYGSLSVLWSIAIEEQFYLVWPLLFSIVPLQWYRFIFPVLIGLGFLALPFVPVAELTHSTFTCMVDLTIGGWAAYVAFNSATFIDAFAGFSRAGISAVYLLGFALIGGLSPLSQYLELGPKTAFITSKIIFCLFFAFIILEQNYATNSFYKASNLKKVSTLGLYTYSLYMLHMLCITVVVKVLSTLKLNTKAYQVLLLQTSLGFISSVIAAWVSYNFLEKRFLKLKKRFEHIKATRLDDDLVEENEDELVMPDKIIGR